MSAPRLLAAPLAVGDVHRFADWPNPAVPSVAAGTYTVWHSDGRFVYVGMSGRTITETTTAPARRYGLYTRLQSHAAGRRSGDQFCVYVADRLVLPTLTLAEIDEIASGRHSMDAFVRRYIRAHLSYRFVVVRDGATARAIEDQIKRGEWEPGQPLLNPARA